MPVVSRGYSRIADQPINRPKLADAREQFNRRIEFYIQAEVAA